LPFIPLEKEIDDLIAYSRKKTATILQLLKETGMRIGEDLDLEWVDVDFERGTILLNSSGKHGNPRAFEMTDKLIPS
jgi:integrase